MEESTDDGIMAPSAVFDDVDVLGDDRSVAADAVVVGSWLIGDDDTDSSKSIISSS